MTALSPEQATFLLHWELNSLKNEQAATRNVIAAIPFEKAEYRPDPHSKSAIELAWHIAATENRLMAGVADGAFDFTPSPRPETVKTPADIAHWLSEKQAVHSEKLAKLTGEQAAKVIDFRGMFQLPAVAYIRFVANHSVHHRGQLSSYLRAMGGKVPAIYGESYDSAESKKAANS